LRNTPNWKRYSLPDIVPIVGAISDTHGLLRPEVLKLFKSVDLILHAGDIGDPQILEQLTALAPTIAVRGNNDKGEWARRIPESRQMDVGGISIFMIHDVKEITASRHSGADIILSGHSHKPSIERRDRVLYLNPGSAGPRRFKLPVSVARITISKSQVTARLIEIRI
jgi:putative phosphoesterase